MRAEGKWQCSELTGQPTYLRATATGTVSDYSDAFGIDNHVYDFAFIRLILNALQLGLPLADPRRPFEHRPNPVARWPLFLCRSQSCRVGTTSELTAAGLHIAGHGVPATSRRDLGNCAHTWPTSGHASPVAGPGMDAVHQSGDAPAGALTVSHC